MIIREVAIELRVRMSVSPDLGTCLPAGNRRRGGGAVSLRMVLLIGGGFAVDTGIEAFPERPGGAVSRRDSGRLEVSTM
jgi:hypothetical protein